uniref:Uncharacterized protein n=1 Tax=Candidatus Kentrum sp. MB TaxID=2138164 RepID=A0A450XUE9_9GAMM|nr:MAG: hypothetical protein BECKMB1821G_GA0114241_11285 [Candidatus Kentron sp. MB]VFK35556.1 MAG: hypothetical protein BECKMB1821I_GA0114274_11275 [Candidatus Kentron sp. MB]VFK77391.1 MAG: hypothetical protein BECKMB1821H_GA0114242_11325 [Candidatus Kentron sp. MB]
MDKTNRIDAALMSAHTGDIMHKRSSASYPDLSQTARRTADETADDNHEAGLPEKNPAAVALGRLGGIKGGVARAKKLSARERSRIARVAASARWSNHVPKSRERANMRWYKILTRSDAQQKTQGAKMPFLRFTKGNISGDHITWFRKEFFGDLPWSRDFSKKDHTIETTRVALHVTIDGNDLGVRIMRLDHDPIRSENNNAPTTHLHYDTRTRQALEKTNLAGRTVELEKDSEGNYSLSIYQTPKK